MRETRLYDYVYSRNHCLRRFSAGLNMCDWRLDMTARDKGAPDKGHTTLFSSSKVVHYFPNFRSYFGMEYEQPWNMGKVLLEWYWKRGLSMFIGFQLCVFQSLGRIKRGERIWTILAHWCRSMNMLYTSRIYIYIIYTLYSIIYYYYYYIYIYTLNHRYSWIYNVMTIYIYI